MGPPADVFPGFSALEAYRHGKAGTGRLFVAGIRVPALLPAIAVLGRMFGQGGIGADLFDDGFQRCFYGAYVCIPSEDVYGKFFLHGFEFI